MFTAPPEATLEWNDAAVEGSYRFVRRVWNYAVKAESALKVGLGVDRSQSITFSAEAKKLRFEIHSVLRQANYDYERMQYNTVVSALMKMLNTLEDSPLSASKDVNDNAALAECYSILLRVMYPACPHLAFQLWNELGYGACCGDLLDVAWPGVDETALQRDEIELMLQINGKLRGSLTVPANADKAAIEQAAAAHEQVTKQGAGAGAQENHCGARPLGERGSLNSNFKPSMTVQSKSQQNTAHGVHRRVAMKALMGSWGLAALALSGCGFQLRQPASCLSKQCS
jgi:leucyl-tRNA synthetase